MYSVPTTRLKNSRDARSATGRAIAHRAELCVREETDRGDRQDPADRAPRRSSTIRISMPPQHDVRSASASPRDRRSRSMSTIGQTSVTIAATISMTVEEGDAMLAWPRRVREET
jgi:hypothetical protein